MKRAFQIAAAIVLASALVFVGRLVLLNVAVKSVTTTIQTTTDKTIGSVERAVQKQRNEAEARKVRAEEEKRRELEANCYIITADGRKLTCATP